MPVQVARQSPDASGLRRRQPKRRVLGHLLLLFQRLGLAWLFDLFAVRSQSVEQPLDLGCRLAPKMVKVAKMQETIQVLLGLQELDTKIYSVKDELRRLPAERERRRKVIDARIATREDLDNEILRLHMSIKEVDMDTTQSRQKVRKYEGELNDTTDGTVVASLQHQIRSLKRDISQAEEEGLESVGESEELTAKRELVQAEIEKDEGFFAEFEENMKKEMAEAEVKLKNLVADRAKRLSGELDAAVVDAYSRLLDSREGVALSMLDGRTCTMCYMEVPANLSVRIARGSELVRCPSCDRILYQA